MGPAAPFRTDPESRKRRSHPPMNSAAVFRSRSPLAKVTGYAPKDFPHLTAIAFEFEEEDMIVLGTDADPGGLIWLPSIPKNSEPVVVVGLEQSVGLYMGRFSGMSRQESPREILQIEFVDREWQSGFTMQFRATFGGIEIYRLVKMEHRAFTRKERAAPAPRRRSRRARATRERK